MEAFFADVEGNERVAVGGEGFGTGCDVRGVDFLHGGGRLHEGERRPFGLGEGRAAPQEFAAHAAVEEVEGVGHVGSVGGWGLFARAVFVCGDAAREEECARLAADFFGEHADELAQRREAGVAGA